MDIKKILSEMPEFKTFFTMAEMDASTMQLARDFPELVTVTTPGYSTEGRPMHCIKIGDYGRNALIFASPHPNEPIGSTMLEYFTRRLCEDKALRDELGYTFYFIKSVDPDGTVLNEGWFKGPYTVSNYARDYFRPSSEEQTEWSFPIEYKGYKFDRPTMETQCLMKVIEEVKPEYMFSLHNSGFGGVYWYLTDDIPECYPEMYGLVKDLGMPLHVGEPEVPNAVVYSKAIYELISFKSMYDFAESMAAPGTDPAKLRSGGAGSAEYAFNFCKPFGIVCEAPYFVSPEFHDESPTDVRRRDAVLSKMDKRKEFMGWVAGVCEKMIPMLTPGNRFRGGLIDRAKMGRGPRDDGTRKLVETSPEYDRPATVAELFDNTVVPGMGRLFTYSAIFRGAETELDRYEHTEEEKALLREIAADARERFEKNAAEFEKTVNYSAVAIKTLASVQLGCALITLRHCANK